MSNTYVQSTGELYNDSGELIGKGYSGHPPHRNDPSAEGLRGVGPIPFGTYNITAMELVTDTHGPFVLVLSPDGLTQQRIRELDRDPDSFRIHGDEIKNPGFASEGCIIMPRVTREALWQGSDHIVDVIDKLEADASGTQN